MSNFISDSEFKPDTPAPEAAPSGFIPDSQFKPDQAMSSEQEANAEQAQDEALQSKYGTTGQQVIAGAEALGRGVSGPIAPYVETKLGVKPEDIRGREEANPATSIVGTIGGLLTPGGQGALLAKAGETAAKGVAKVIPSIVGEGVLAGMSRTAVKLAAENALYQSGDETSKMILNDPGQTVGTAITNIGLAGALGAVAGGTLGAVSPLWKAAVGNKASQLAADFKGRLDEHIANPDRVGSFTDELNDYYKNIKGAADEVYGPTGIKAQEISKLMPEEITPKISEQVEKLNTDTQDAIKKMVDKGVPERYTNKYVNDLNTFQKIATEPGVTPTEVFNAAQDLKQTLQGYSKGNFGPFAVPSYHEAYDFLNITKNVGHDLRTALEDSSVWGKAADRQLAVNKAFKDYLPALKDFEKKFTSEVAGERVIDPGKASTYVNQLGKSNAELKQTMLKNFLDASEHYKQVLDESHQNLGISNPIGTTSRNMIDSTLKEPSHGAQLADMWIKHSNAIGGKAIGAGIGALLGAATHIPYASHVGAIVGEHALGPFFKSILPSIAKAILEKPASGTGLKAATEYGLNIIKGQKLTNAAIKNVFNRGSDVLPESKRPSVEMRKKLDAALQSFKQDPSKLVNAGGDIGHYLPQHSVVIGSTLLNAVNFLNSIKPQTAPRAPLDPPIKVSKAVESQYNRALDIAQQPLTVLESIKNGTLTSHDIMAISTIYPDLYTGLKQKIMDQMVDHVSKGENVPYDTRLGLSMFLQQPLDSTMSPMAISSAQPAPQQPQQGQQQGQQGASGPKKVSSSAANSMIKGSKSVQTAAQASESMHSTGKA